MLPLALTEYTETRPVSMLAVCHTHTHIPCNASFPPIFSCILRNHPVLPYLLRTFIILTQHIITQFQALFLQHCKNSVFLSEIGSTFTSRCTAYASMLYSTVFYLINTSLYLSRSHNDYFVNNSYISGYNIQ